MHNVICFQYCTDRVFLVIFHNAISQHVVYNVATYCNHKSVNIDIIIFSYLKMHKIVLLTNKIVFLSLFGGCFFFIK